MFLAGRLRAAAARGEIDQLEINPALRARKDQFEREQREMAETMPVFIDEIVDKLRGQRIWVLATWNILYAIAQAGLSKGLSRLFASDSLVSTGGGAKGAVVPDDWEHLVREFTGVDHIQHKLRDVGDHRAEQDVRTRPLPLRAVDHPVRARSRRRSATSAGR